MTSYLKKIIKETNKKEAKMGHTEYRVLFKEKNGRNNSKAKSESTVSAVTRFVIPQVAGLMGEWVGEWMGG